MIAAGFIAGLLPLVHAHSFVVVMMVAGCIAIGTHWRSWLAIAIGALPLIVLTYYSYPQLPRLNQNIGVLGIAVGRSTRSLDSFAAKPTHSVDRVLRCRNHSRVAADVVVHSQQRG